MFKVLQHGSLAIVAALVVGAATPSHAQSGRGPTGWMGGTLDTNLYIGGNVGQARYRNACEGAGIPCDEKDTGFRVFAGYKFHRNLAVETGYFDLGKASASGAIGGGVVSAELKARGWELLGVMTVPVWQQLSLLAKAGVARTRLSATGTAAVGGVAFAASAKENSTDFTYGLGVEYAFTPNIGARLEWQRYDGVGGDTTGKGDIDLFSAGLLYRF